MSSSFDPVPSDRLEVTSEVGAALTDFDYRIAASLLKLTHALRLPKDTLGYLVDYLSLNQPMIPASQVIGFSEFWYNPPDLPEEIKTGKKLLAALGIYSQGGAGFNYNPSTAVGSAYTSQVYGAANPLFSVSVDGIMSWGAGGATAVDTNLYRSAANTLKTDDALIVVGNVTLPNILHTNVIAANTNLVQAGKKIALYDGAAALQGYIQLYTA